MADVVFLEPWEGVREESSGALLSELKAEVAPGHPLYGVDLKTIARSIQEDDVLFQFEDGRVVDVHLTWRRTIEPLPWPKHRMFPSLKEWMQQIMIPLHEEMT